MRKRSIKKEDTVYFLAFVLLAVGLYLNEPQSGSGTTRVVTAAGEAILIGAVLAAIPWGIAKIIVRIMRKPSYPEE